jgi:hypothetical protein
MNTKDLSKSTRTFIRREKARIRRENPDLNEQQKQVNALNLQFHKA